MMTSRPTLRDFATIPALAAVLVFTLSTTSAARPPRRAGEQSPGPGQAQPRPLPTIPTTPDQPEIGSPSPLTPKQQRQLLKSRYEKIKQEATTLAGLAKSLQEDLDKSNSDVLSLTVVDKADKIEKLAKKIRTEAVQ